MLPARSLLAAALACVAVSSTPAAPRHRRTRALAKTSTVAAVNIDNLELYYDQLLGGAGGVGGARADTEADGHADGIGSAVEKPQLPVRLIVTTRTRKDAEKHCAWAAAQQSVSLCKVFRMALIGLRITLPDARTLETYLKRYRSSIEHAEAATIDSAVTTPSWPGAAANLPQGGSVCSIFSDIISSVATEYQYPTRLPGTNRTLWGLDRIDASGEYPTRLPGTRGGLDRIDASGGAPRKPTLDSNFTYVASAGRNSRVYVLDTGIDCAHEEFYRVAGDASQGSRCEIGAEFLSDMTGGVDRVCDRCDCRSSSECCAYDGNSHGTHCAGTIVGTNTGVAKKATVIAVKVLSNNGDGGRADILQGIDWVGTQQQAYPNHTIVLSLSLGGAGVSQAYETAFANLLRAGIVSVVAAGNSDADACDFSPAFAPSAITVGATNSDDGRASPEAGQTWGSNYGACVDVFGPGVDIESSYTGGGYASYSGTSMAAPHAAGVVALYGTENPCLTGEQLFQHTATTSATPNVVSDPNGSPNKLVFAGCSPRNSGCPTPDLDVQVDSCAPTTSPTAAPTTPTTSPTLSPTAPTSSPSMTPPNYRGRVVCGETVTGNTSNFGPGLNNRAPDNWFKFDIIEIGPHSFNTCASAYDTWLRVYSIAAGGDPDDPIPGREIFECDDCGSCLDFRTEIVSGTTPSFDHLAVGSYLIVIEGFGTLGGEYRIDFTCPGNRTMPPIPSHSPSLSPTPSPLSPLTYQSALQCGETATGDTSGSREHWFLVDIKSVGPHGFNTCMATFDTWLRIYTVAGYLESGIPVAGTEVMSCDDCGPCADYQTEIITGEVYEEQLYQHLEPAKYLVTIQGYEEDEGNYTFTFGCPAKGAALCLGELLPASSICHGVRTHWGPDRSDPSPSH